MTRPTHAALVRLFEEARRVLVSQVSVMRGLDEKAAQILRFNVLTSGLIITAASLVVSMRPADVAFRIPGLASIAGGFVLLVLSTGAALLAHRAERLHLGLGAEGPVGALQFEVDEEGVLIEAIRTYGEEVIENGRIRERTVRRLAWSAWSLLGAVVILAAGAMHL